MSAEHPEPEDSGTTFERQIARYLDQYRKGLITHNEFVLAVAGAVAEDVEARA